MKINKLIGIERTLEMIKDGMFHTIDSERQTGRSTALAFSVISSAMDRPDTWHQIVDHHNTHQASMCLLNMVKSIIRKLKLKGFDFRVSPPSIRFSIFDEYEEIIIWRKVKKG